ncbi:AAA family ATPase [Christiangramia sp.]|uniref:AAA family ATPase n=1 Tax=Christiangramia sp. TaxID=1931228 RepID=UPI0026200FF9|nr:AAA family ATPase [Christiangramia sp.]
MKILKVEFENINSLKGFHEIDFSIEPFVTNSLFAITGPTGSGKSSILDVICLAIFGKIPRIPGSREISRNDIEKMGTILTRNQESAFARVTYESRFGKFIAQWDISTNRNGNLRNPDMEIKDASDGSIITSKKSEAPGKNEELIGLNYDQFIKSVLLAQGEFAQFLKTRKEERGELLEKITGTGIYRQLGIKAFEKNREATKEIQQQQYDIESIKRDLLDEEKLKEYTSELQQKNKLSDTQEKEIEALKKALDLKQDIANTRSDIQKQQNELNSSLENLKEFEDKYGRPLTQHEIVQPKADELRKWQQAENTSEALTKKKEELAASIETNKIQLKKLLKNTSELIKKNTNAEELSSDLNNFRDRILLLQGQKQKKLDLYNSKADLLQTELRDSQVQFVNKDLENLKTTLDSELKKYTALAEEINKKLDLNPADDIDKNKQRIKTKIDLARKASRDFSLLENLKSEISSRQKELDENSSKLKQLPEQIRKAQFQAKDLQKELQNLRLTRENQKLRASLEQHRAKLIDGEVCPLCGSEHHPYAENNEEEKQIDDNSLHLAEQKTEKAQKELSQLEATYRNLNEQILTIEKALKPLQENEKTKKRAFSEKFAEFNYISDQQKFDEIIEQLESQLDLITGFEKIQNNKRSIENAIPIANEMQSIKKDGVAIKKELDSLYEGKNIQQDVQQLMNSWNRLQQDHVHLHKLSQENQDLIVANQKIISRTAENLKQFLSETGFDTIDEAGNALMPEAEVLELRKKKQQHTKAVEDCRTSIKVLETQLQNKQQKDTEIEKEVLEDSLKKIIESCNNLKNECKELERQLKNNADQVSKMKRLKEEIAEKEKQTRRWRMLNELIGDSRGKMFNDFAQDLTLTHLLSLANIRLKDLNDRYLIDKPGEDEDDGLIAIDEHMGGQRRSIKTLSGGETFILSLSMALALSDLASKSVDINSLFIDEGFGTLDPETLDQTLDTLEKLQAESSKTIGIISHVESLKERITTQIQLSRNGQGYSKLRITPEPEKYLGN